MATLYKKDWPQFLLSIPELKGIAYDDCCEGWIWEKNDLGHAHTEGAHVGWICIKKKTLLKDYQLLRHETAHLIAPGGHHDAWREAVKKLGGHIEEYTFKYDKRRPEVHVSCYHPECIIEREAQAERDRNSKIAKFLANADRPLKNMDDATLRSMIPSNAGAGDASRQARRNRMAAGVDLGDALDEWSARGHSL